MKIPLKINFSLSLYILLYKVKKKKPYSTVGLIRKFWLSKKFREHQLSFWKNENHNPRSACLLAVWPQVNYLIFLSPLKSCCKYKVIFLNPRGFYSNWNNVNESIGEFSLRFKKRHFNKWHLSKEEKKQMHLVYL